MKKILYLSDNNINTIGGSQKSVYTIINNLRNYDISLFMPKNDDNNKEICRTYYYRKHKICWYIYILTYKPFAVYKTIKKEKPDIVHAQNMECGMILGLLRKFRFIPKNIKCIYTDRGFINNYSKKYRLLFKFVAKKFDYVVTTTNINKNYWEKLTNKPNVFYISNVLDTTWNDFNKNEKVLFKKKYNIENKINIGFAGRYCEIKNWEFVKQICERLSIDNKFIFSLVLTADNSEEKSKMDAYISDMKKISIDQVKIYTDLDEIKMKEFYYTLDMFVLTSTNESFGRTLLEAMTKKNVVFGTICGGVPDVIKNEEFLYKINDLETICKKIYKYTDLGNRKKAISYFNCLYKDNYSIITLVEKHKNLYEL